MQDNNDDLAAYESSDPEDDVQNTGNGNKKPDQQAPNKPDYVGTHATSFKDFLLKDELLRAINEAGFEHPSQVQQECIPTAVYGTDILCQAKSGMGKTAVFVLTILQRLDEDPEPCSAIIIANVKELAYQIHKEIERLGKYLKNIRSAVFFGGQPVQENMRLLEGANAPHIIVGTPGRLLHLCRDKILKLDKLKFFVLDECDKLVDELDMRSTVQQIFRHTPHEKQVLMFSATLSHKSRLVCKKFTLNSQDIFIDDEKKLTLEGLQQFYVKLTEKEKNRKLIDILDAVQFNQCMIFVNKVKRAQTLNRLLVQQQFPAICVYGKMPQEQRIKSYKIFKSGDKRVMVASDVLSRGIDYERVNLVFNYDMAPTSNTYLHRVGRAGRFGTKGMAVSFISTEEDNKVMDDVKSRFIVKINELPETFDESQIMN